MASCWRRRIYLAQAADLVRDAAHPDGEADATVQYERKPQVEAVAVGLTSTCTCSPRTCAARGDHSGDHKPPKAAELPRRLRNKTPLHQPQMPGERNQAEPPADNF